MKKFNTLINSSLVPSSFAASIIHLDAILWYISLHDHPFLYTDWWVSNLVIGLFLGDGSLSLFNSYSYTRREYIFSWVVSLIGVSQEA